ncbi:hypothetical protein V8E54_004318 [Elaphomyces granulatus]
MIITLPPALPTNHHGSVSCEGASSFAGVLLQAPVPQPRPRLGREADRPATPHPDKVDSKEEKWWWACYGQIEQLAKELEMPRGASTVQLCWLMDKAGEEGQDRVSLCKRGTSSRQKAPRGLIRNPEGGATPSLTLYHLVLLCCSNIYLYLNTRAAAILLSDMHNGGFMEGLGEGR